MPSKPVVANSRWVIFAIPAVAIAVPLLVALIILAVRPAKEPAASVASRDAAPLPSAPSATATPETTEPLPAAPAVESAPAPVARPPSPAVTITAPSAATPQSATTPGIAVVATKPSSSPPVAEGLSQPIDLLAALDLDSSIITGDWRREGSAIRCTNATPSSRAKVRLAAPPPGGGYDLSVTFTAQGERRFVAPILSFRGRQFIFAMMSKQSGFASVRGQNALANETTRNKGINAGKRHTVVIKVRDHEVSAHLDGELLSTYTTDYGDLDVSNAWNLGPSSTRENLLGLAVECPTIVASIKLTPLEAQAVTTAPAAASSYKDLAAMISSPFSRESSAAATQPAASARLDAAALQSIVATSQPTVSEVAADLLEQTSATSPAAANGARDELLRAVQLAISPIGLPPDPLLDSQPANRSPIAIEVPEFVAELSRLAAWRVLMGRMSELYPDAKSQGDVVKLRLAPEAESANKGKLVAFFAAHSASEPLTNVTLAVEIVHAMTSPSPTATHYYFIKRWPAGQKIYFPSACIPNVASRELLENPGPAVLRDLSGMIEARVQLWSDKVAQPQQTISFDANFQNIAHAQLGYAYGLVDEALRRPASASRPASTSPAPAPTVRANALVVGPIIPARADLNDDSPDLARARAIARRARGLLPPQSKLADDARDLVAQPQAALRDLRKRQVDAFVAALAPRTSRAGVWLVHKPGLLAKLVKPADREAAVGAAGADGGRITLTIDGRMSDASAVDVTLTSADQPETRRKFTGRLQVDASAGDRLILNLRATQPPPPRKTADDLKRIVHWTSLLLELRGNALVGIATAGPTESATVFNVAFAPPAAAPAPANPRPSPAPRPRPTTSRAK